MIADYESRKGYKDAEWMLNPEVFQKAIKHLKFKPDLDYFTSRLYTQLTKYISYKPDPYVYLIDAFSVHRGFYKCYLFPPFSLIGRTFQKVCMDQAEVILVVPKWLTQPWFNTSQAMLSQEQYVVTPHKENLILPQKKKKQINRRTAALVVGTNTSDRESVRGIFLSQGFDNDTVDVLKVSWRKGTFSN